MKTATKVFTSPLSDLHGLPMVRHRCRSCQMRFYYLGAPPKTGRCLRCSAKKEKAHGPR